VCTRSRSRLRVSVISTNSPEKVRHAALEAIFGPIADNPNRLGKPLVGELEGLWSARRGDYRIIYEVFEDDQIVLIHRVQHRRDAYRPH
jgi:mRNA interferase RelE/StbE